VDGHLGRVGPGDQVRRAQQVEEFLAAHPGSPAHHLVFHHRDVRGGPAEGRGAEAEKEKRDLGERRAGLHVL
jgi:hypothetical protein